MTNFSHKTIKFNQIATNLPLETGTSKEICGDTGASPKVFLLNWRARAESGAAVEFPTSNSKAGEPLTIFIADEMKTP